MAYLDFCKANPQSEVDAEPVRPAHAFSLTVLDLLDFHDINGHELCSRW